MEQIIDFLGEPEILAQLAEEASELAQAALKLRRAIDETNPTPKTETECRAALLEEIADVQLCMQELGFQRGDKRFAVGKIISRKQNRWIERLVNGCGEGGTHNAP